MRNHPERIIESLQALGVKKFRFSISRDKIEPYENGLIDEEALLHYAKFCRLLLHCGIEPMVTLHHFSDPLYFSWERAGDISGFVRYAEVVSDMLYQEGVRKIITINEPGVIMSQGYVMGNYPPHHTSDFQGAAHVFEHMMIAHQLIYESLHARHPGFFEIGIAHDPIRFRYYHKWNPIWTPIERVLCHFLTELHHSAIMRFFQTGEFTLWIPFFVDYTFRFNTPPSFDFIGLQYYSDPLIKISFSGGDSVARDSPEQKLSAMRYRTYPQGLASALEEFRSLNVPIDLTEIGIEIGINTDSSDNERIQYFDKIFQVVEKALAQGVPVRSLYFWSLFDNLEWHEGFAMRFGFYRFDQTTGILQPRPVCTWLQRLTANSALPR